MPLAECVSHGLLSGRNPCKHKSACPPMRSSEMVRVSADTDEWLACSWMLGPFKIIETCAIRREVGTDFSWQWVSKEPLKAVFIFNMSVWTMFAALARETPSLSASSSHALCRADPKSWLKASRISRPHLCCLMSEKYVMILSLI